MVAGMESFIHRFRDYSDCYTIIGGAACDILMTEADTDFRVTKDIDMILIMDARQQEFVKEFWEYILEGGYRFWMEEQRQGTFLQIYGSETRISSYDRTLFQRAGLYYGCS